MIHGKQPIFIYLDSHQANILDMEPVLSWYWSCQYHGWTLDLQNDGVSISQTTLFNNKEDGYIYIYELRREDEPLEYYCCLKFSALFPEKQKGSSLASMNYNMAFLHLILTNFLSIEPPSFLTAYAIRAKVLLISFTLNSLNKLDPI